MVSGANDNPDDVSMSDWFSIVKMKANIDDVNRLNDTKANKHDSEQQMRALDIMHRQVTHLSVLLLEVQK